MAPNGRVPRPHTGAQAVAFIVLYLLVITSPLTVSWLAAPETDDEFPVMLALHNAMVGFAIIAMQPVLAARLKWFERYYGLDMVYRFHMSMAVLAAVLILSHPVLLTFEFGWQLLYSPDVPWVIWLGRIGALALLVQAVTSIFRARIKLEFQKWLKIHNTVGLTLFAGAFVHSLVIGPDIQRPPVRLLWVLLLIAGTVAYTYHRVFAWYWRRSHTWTVDDVRSTARGVWTTRISPPPDQKVYSYLPGQFHFLVFRRGRNLPVEEHHWTISSSPTEEGFVQSSIKESGDFTRTISQTQPGDKVQVQGAFGRFSYVLHPEERDLIFIAGGIGITPFRAMLRHMADVKADKEVTLIFANRTEADIAFHDELETISHGAKPRLKVIHILEKPPDSWKGEKGRLDAARLKGLVGADAKTSGYYVCAPPGMADMAIETLLEAGVPAARIHEERFWFL